MELADCFIGQIVKKNIHSMPKTVGHIIGLSTEGGEILLLVKWVDANTPRPIHPANVQRLVKEIERLEHTPL